MPGRVVSCDTKQIWSFCATYLVQTWGHLCLLFQGVSIRNLSVDSLWGAMLQEETQNVGEKQPEGTVAVPLMAGNSEHMRQARPVVHVYSFDPLIYIRSAHSWGTGLTVLTVLVSEHQYYSIFYIGAAALNTVKLDKHSGEREPHARNLKWHLLWVSRSNAVVSLTFGTFHCRLQFQLSCCSC